MELERMDVRTVFLHGNPDETIFMKQPEGFEVLGQESKACLLKKSLYDLKQSLRRWYKHFDNFRMDNSFSRSAYNSYVYFKRTTRGCNIPLLLHVDDILMACESMSEIMKLKDQLAMDSI
ncbi:hypothetical protein F511_24105 [Dorcoceras hygrometricum]|uniref:Reverse transcriptase Ty1/copia-type domain-containing protein n=1 Tax=Dorcoceras hygrometricum TaxID=472368 RepID=A0A2Z7A6E2_9LAMI|nr:hypothetical protein F511_24105 [Dorcoceras hygrometricum]